MPRASIRSAATGHPAKIIAVAGLCVACGPSQTLVDADVPRCFELVELLQAPTEQWLTGGIVRAVDTTGDSARELWSVSEGGPQKGVDETFGFSPDGAGRFSPWSQIELPGGVISTADLDGDGRSEFVSTRVGLDGGEWFRTGVNGDGSMLEPRPYGAWNGGFQPIRWFDANADGIADQLQDKELRLGGGAGSLWLLGSGELLDAGLAHGEDGLLWMRSESSRDGIQLHVARLLPGPELQDVWSTSDPAFANAPPSSVQSWGPNGPIDVFVIAASDVPEATELLRFRIDLNTGVAEQEVVLTEFTDPTHGDFDGDGYPDLAWRTIESGDLRVRFGGAGAVLGVEQANPNAILDVDHAHTRGSPVALNDDGVQSLLFRLPDPRGTQVISTVAFHDCDEAGPVHRAGAMDSDGCVCQPRAVMPR